jgi:membrane fusion protein (multidrug efflux system)
MVASGSLFEDQFLRAEHLFRKKWRSLTFVIFRKRSRFGCLCGFLALAAIFSGGCEKQSNIVLPEITVSVTPAIQRDVPIHGEWIGTLTGTVNADVRAQVSGYLLSQNYTGGRTVKKGDLLFQIDPRIFEANLALAKAQLAQSQAQLDRTQIEVTRDEPLAKQGAISQQELDNAVQSNLAAKADVDAAKANVDKATIELQFTKVTSPVDGIPGLANAQVGDLVSPSSGVLATVSAVDPIKALFTISEQDYLKLIERMPEPGLRTEFRDQLQFQLVFPNGQTYPKPGKFDSIQRQVDSRTGTLQIAATFSNPGDLLRPGQFVRVRAVTHDQKGAVLVPQRSVIELQSLYQVAVVGAGDKIEIRTVEAGERVGGWWVITKGLAAGTQVVTEGLQKVQDGQKVKIVPPDVPQPAPTTMPDKAVSP